MAYNDDSHILSWIRDIPFNPPSPSQPHHRKRTPSDSEQLASPPCSQESRRANLGVEMPSLSALAVAEDGVEVAPLQISDKRIPHSLIALSRNISNVVGVVPKYLEAEIAKLNERNDSPYTDFGSHVFLDSEKTYLPHLAPTIELAAVQLIVAGAADACRNQFDESGWNTTVHAPLLYLVFYGKECRGTQLHRFQACTRAGVQPAYLINNAQGKKVHFVFYVDAQYDSDPQPHQLINKIRPILKDTSIDHSSQASLCAHPISVKLLGDKVDELEFIPGIIVHGDQWFFVASTYSRSTNKTILWYSRSCFGSTDALLWTFKAIASIQHLRAWSDEILWRWYKQHLPAAHASLCSTNTSMT
ncbi:uncharacterized protein FIESC28_09799 [Fusarium coffeatum]|uniref:PD-(D/E)XK nuclease-like domain-containing protein n=1 Tax=Fusarium coffeatum TaxID=231269 RepID=A0A366R000_9HYPO|nr:uncharacterized protein FIESC28_09799 [Fusarium coffeatum]RBR09580.1 hypothetical protein FIESC28_09799 [Fusarium coffeatum]